MTRLRATLLPPVSSSSVMLFASFFVTCCSAAAWADAAMMTMTTTAFSSAFHQVPKYHESSPPPHAFGVVTSGFKRASLGRFSAGVSLAPQQLGEFEPLLCFSDGDEDEEYTARTNRRVWLYDLVSSSSEKTVPYNDAWDLQKSLVAHQLSRIGKRPSDAPLYDQFVPLSLEIIDAENVESLNNTKLFDDDDDDERSSKAPSRFIGCDSVIMLQHDPVYTLGTASDPSFIRGYDKNHASKNNNNNISISSSSIPIARIERGGEVTYHGPGQLTVYPIIDLRGYKKDVHWYMRALEEVILLALKRSGVRGATRENNLTGVWVSNKKIAALGIKTRRWVTMHGLAINIDIRSIPNFDGIVPCGLKGRQVTCVNDEIEADQADIGNNARHSFTVAEFASYVKSALEDVLGITLISAQ